MLNGGEDPRYIARRLVRFAAEDIGMADPQALTQALAGWETYERLGSPEGELAIAQVVIYLGTAPKSNAIYAAYSAARAAAKATGSLMPPAHILNAPTKLMKELGYGVRLSSTTMKPRMHSRGRIISPMAWHASGFTARATAASNARSANDSTTGPRCAPSAAMGNDQPQWPGTQTPPCQCAGIHGRCCGA